MVRFRVSVKPLGETLQEMLLTEGSVCHVFLLIKFQNHLICLCYNGLLSTSEAVLCSQHAMKLLSTSSGCAVMQNWSNWYLHLT